MSGENLQYRLAEDGDLNAVYDLYMDAGSNPFLTYDLMPKEEFQKIFEGLLPSKTLFVATAGIEVVATYRLVPKTDRQKHTVYLGGFSIKSSWKGRGIGTQVLQHIRQTAASQGKKRIELTVDINNPDAIRLYQKLGFEKEGYIRNSYIINGTFYDEILMALILD
jgi:putative acetyltransferase